MLRGILTFRQGTGPAHKHPIHRWSTRMKLPVLFFILLAVATAPASKDEPYQLGTFQNGSMVRLAADRVNIRSTPSLSGSVIATLPIGSKLRITSKSDVSSTINRLTAPWYAVSFGDRGGGKKGFVWGGLLSVASLDLKDAGGDEVMLAGISVTPDNSVACRVTLLRGGTVAGKVEFNPPGLLNQDGTYDYSVTGELYGGRGLKGVAHVIALSFNYPACGYPFGTVLVIYDGTALYQGVRTLSMVEAGVFHVIAKPVFPDEKEGVKDSVVVVTTHEEFNEESKEYRVTKIEKKIHRWEGKGFTEVK